MKRLLAIITITGICVAHVAAGVFSARTAIDLAKLHGTTKSMLQTPSNDDATMLHAIVTVADVDALARLGESGATVHSCFGNSATVTMPLSDIDKLASIEGIKSIELERTCTLTNNMARELSFFPSLYHSYDGFNSPVYTGSGVVVGVIDVGVDFNHINFLDNSGNNRIVRAYLPNDSTGTSPVIDGLTLPGSEYTTPQEIRALTTDDSTQYHGTHTTGTAAGSYLENGYNGVATGAQIVVCAMPENRLTDFNIANSVRYIFNYADQVGLPAVINMSIGSQDGAHDGTSTLCELYKQMSGPGRICVVSAGNDGHIPMNVRKNLAENDSLAFFLSNWTSREPMRGFSSLWSRSGNRHSVDVVIWDIKADSLVHRLDIPQDSVLDSVYVVSSDADPVFAQYFTGELYFACALENNGLFHSLIETNYSSIDKSKYRIGVVNKAPAGETLMAWSGGKVVYSSCSLNGWTGGVAGSGCTVSDLATTDSVISVGAYCSNSTFVMMSGDTTTVSRCYPYDIAYFSGYGPDACNKTRPDVVAPGFQVASSVSRFAEKFNDPSNVVDNVVANGHDNPYGLEGGTSMSTPVVVGAIALWLQIEPNLSTSDVRQIMEQTCYHDAYVDNGPAKKWGFGKLDIDAGIKLLLGRLEGDVNNDGVVNAADVTCLYDIMLGNSINHIQRADVDCDNAITAADVSFLYNKILGL